MSKKSVAHAGSLVSRGELPYLVVTPYGQCVAVAGDIVEGLVVLREQTYLRRLGLRLFRRRDNALLALTEYKEDRNGNDREKNKSLGGGQGVRR